MATQLGKPAVIDPRELTLREVQQVISNIRQRLGALDSTLSTVQQLQNVGRQSTATDLTSLQRQIDNLQKALAAVPRGRSVLIRVHRPGSDARTQYLVLERDQQP